MKASTHWPRRSARGPVHAPGPPRSLHHLLHLFLTSAHVWPTHHDTNIRHPSSQQASPKLIRPSSRCNSMCTLQPSAALAMPLAQAAAPVPAPQALAAGTDSPTVAPHQAPAVACGTPRANAPGRSRTQASPGRPAEELASAPTWRERLPAAPRPAAVAPAAARSAAHS